MIGYELEAPLVNADHFRPFWRRSTQIDRLFADGSIRTLDYRAALAYRLPCRVDRRRRLGGATGWRRATARPEHDGATVHRISASQRLQWVRLQIGSPAARLCDQVIIANLPWAELGRRYELEPENDALACHRRDRAAFRRHVGPAMMIPTTASDRVRKFLIEEHKLDHVNATLAVRAVLDELTRPDAEMLRAGAEELRHAIARPQPAHGFDAYIRNLAGVVFRAMLNRADR